jgi:hypothetical protein
VTDQSTPSPATDQASEPSSPQPGARRRSPYGKERVAVGAIFLALVAALIVFGAYQVHTDTFRVPPAGHPITSCSDEVGRLYTEFSGALLPFRLTRGNAFVPRRPSAEAQTRAELAQLDEDLAALRPYCDREGADALRAYTALTVWRFQAQDLSSLDERMLVPDAERALSYRSPNAATPVRSPTGTTHER